jgi:hypothetical protein
LPLPDVHYGAITDEETDWRSKADLVDLVDDDATLDRTPASVIEMLGFDPLDLEGGDEVPAAIEGESGRAADDRPMKERLSIHGLPVVIEYRKGDVRRGKGWEVEMPADYGYIEGVVGADGDSLDCYIGPDHDSNWIYIVDQRRVPPDKGFDEHKCMLGFANQSDALGAYDAGHNRSKDVFMDWTPMEMRTFKLWMRRGDLTKPCSPDVMS